MFETRTIAEPKTHRLFRRATIVVVAALLIMGAISSYRAYYQVLYLELRSSDSVLRPGSDVDILVKSSARTTIAVKLELIQGTQAQTLSSFELRGNEFGFLDPRSKYLEDGVILTESQLAAFQPGEALLRVTATGRPQWGRTPPPVVREMRVEIR